MKSPVSFKQKTITTTIKYLQRKSITSEIKVITVLP